MNFTFDFFSVDWIALKNQGITMKEMMTVFVNPSSVIDNVNDIDYLIGFSDKRKFLIVAYRLSKNPNFDLEVL